ncbi:unknown [Clostridium sp. CAG:452]|jgi:ABC-type metal ion transport system substrate-binding protein|nr:unknown [Clostridium sp. CAG:452]
MKKIIILLLNENGDIEIMNKNIELDEKTMKDIFETYKKLNIKELDKKDNNNTSIFRYDYTKKSSLDISSFAKV